MYWCSVVLLRGLELQSGRKRVQLSDTRDAYEQAQLFIQTVGAGKALQAARRALNPNKKEKIRWL